MENFRIKNTKSIWMLPALMILTLFIIDLSYQRFAPFIIGTLQYADGLNVLEKDLYFILMGLCGYWLFIRALNPLIAFTKNTQFLQKHPILPIVLPFFITAVKIMVFLILFNTLIQSMDISDNLSYFVEKTTSIFIICAISGAICRLISTAEQLLLYHYTADLNGLIVERKIHTQTLILKRVAYTITAIFTIGAILVLFDNVRALGASVLTTAGVIGLVLTFTAQRSLGSIFAGIEIALTQSIKIGDKIQIENELGTVEEINFRNVIVKMWNWRRLVVPTNFFLEKSFQNWSHVESTNLITSFYLYVDFLMPIEPLRNKLHAIVENSELWDKNVAKMQVSELREGSMQLKIIVSAHNGDDVGNLSDHIREELMTYIVRAFPDFLPKTRATNLKEPSRENMFDTDNSADLCNLT